MDEAPPTQENYPPDVLGRAARIRWDLAVAASPKILGADASAGELRFLTRHLYSSDIET